MQKEACPQCKSETAETVTIEGETWWRCVHQGCDGRISGDRFHWRPGEGLEPKPPKVAKPPKPAAPATEPSGGGDAAASS